MNPIVKTIATILAGRLNDVPLEKVTENESEDYIWLATEIWNIVADTLCVMGGMAAAVNMATAAQERKEAE